MKDRLFDWLYDLNYFYNPVLRIRDYLEELDRRITLTLGYPRTHVSRTRVLLECIKAARGGRDYGLSPDEIAEFDAMDRGIPSRSECEDGCL